MKKVLFLIIICCLSNLLLFSQNNDLVQDKYLIVLDIQEYYTINQLSESSAQKLMDSINYVISKFNPNHVIYIRSLHRLLNLSLSRPFIYVSFDTSAMHFDKRLIVKNKQIFTKDDAYAFSINELNNFLKQNDANQIVIIGLIAEECIYESLLGGKELGYDMYAMPEAVVGKTQKSKNKAIKKLTGLGIKIALDYYRENTLIFDDWKKNHLKCLKTYPDYPQAVEGLTKLK